MMRDVAGAEESQSRSKRYACFAAVAVALFFVLSASGGNQGAEVVGGQAKHHFANHKESDGVAAKDLGLDEDEEFSDALKKFNRTINEQFSFNENMLSGEMDKELEKIESGLADLLSVSGVDFSGDEITKMTEEIRSQLEDNVHKYIIDQVDETLDKEKTEFQNDLDQDAYDTKAEGEEEAESQKSEIIAKLRNKVDDVCISVKKEMKSLAAVAEKEILEQKFKEKTSESYVAKISEENTVISVEKGTEDAPKATKKGTKKKQTPSPTGAPKTNKKNTKKTAKPKPKVEEDEDEGEDEEEDGDEGGGDEE